MMSLKIKKRSGDDASFNPQKIYQRIKRSSKGLNVNSDEIFIKVITSVPTEGIITTNELDKLIYEIAGEKSHSKFVNQEAFAYCRSFIYKLGLYFMFSV